MGLKLKEPYIILIRALFCILGHIKKRSFHYGMTVIFIKLLYTVIVGGL